MYSVRVKSSPTLSLEGLTPLVTYEGKNVPTNKELRVSDGWKVKEVPGAGSSFGRGPHRRAAVDGLEALWTKALRDRECSYAEGGIWHAAVPRDARYVTVGNLRNLLAVTGLIDQLHKAHGIDKGLATRLISHAVKMVGIGELPSQEARLNAAALELAAAPSTRVEDAYRRAGTTGRTAPSKETHWVIQTPAVATGHASKPVVQQPATPPVKQLPAAPDRLAEEPGASKPVVRSESKRKPTSDENLASISVRSILAGAAPIGVAATVTAKEKPFLIAKLVSAIDELGSQSTDAQVYRTKLLRVAKFFDMWQLQKSTPTRPNFTAEDRAALPAWLTEAMSKLTELEANKLPQATR